MSTTGVEKAAAVLLGLEAGAIAALAVRQFATLVSGEVASLATAIALLVVTIVGVVAVAAFGVAVWRGQSWGRSGGIVTQVLILAVALGALTGTFAQPLIAAVLAAPAVVGFLLLIVAGREAGRRGDQTSS